MDETTRVRRHLLDLYERSRTNWQYCFTDFLSPADQSELQLLLQKGEIDAAYVTLFGGYEGAERCAARFGSPADFGWEEPLPIAVLAVSPVLEKFGEALSHRDYLGSLMALGIDRGLIGDIRVAGKNAWVMAQDRIAPFLCEHLTEVRHTHVQVRRVKALPAVAAPQLAAVQLLAASTRADIVAAHLTGTSRAKTAELFRAQRMYLNGRMLENPSAVLKAGDVLSIRGWGKVIFDGAGGQTKKGNLILHLRRYV